MCSISFVCSNDYDLPLHEPGAERILLIGAVKKKDDKRATDEERTTKCTQRLSPGNYFSNKSDNLSRRRRSGDTLPCAPRRTDDEQWTTKHSHILFPGNFLNKSDNLSRRQRSGDDLPCSRPRRTREKSATAPTTTKLRTTRDISKLSQSPKLSRLRRQRRGASMENNRNEVI
jgi:hypothetical protein